MDKCPQHGFPSATEETEMKDWKYVDQLIQASPGSLWICGKGHWWLKGANKETMINIVSGELIHPAYLAEPVKRSNWAAFCQS
jgi:hypothetical protein